VVESLYKEDSELAGDKLLKKFFSECSNPKQGDIKGFPSTPTTIQEVTKTLTKIIWQVSGYHSALNFSQPVSYGYAPFRPAGLRMPLPSLTNF